VAGASRTPKNRKTGKRHAARKDNPAGSPQPGSSAKALFTPDLLALLAHQLVTPVTTIVTLAQSLGRRADELDRTDIRDRAERIRHAGHRLLALIGSIMERARADAGAIKLASRSFDPRAVARRVCQEQRDAHPNRRFVCEIESLPTSIEGDPELLEHVIAILLSNAEKYSPSDRPVAIRVRPSEHGVTITIRDEGMGIPAADLPHLATPFFRAANARSTPGTGLGLSMARHILSLHGGTMQFKSREGKGTEVTIFIPSQRVLSPGEGI
jgi:signal transduction histidine kinase